MKMNLNNFWNTKFGKTFKSAFSEHLFISFLSAWCIVSTISIFTVKSGFDIISFVNNVKSGEFILTLVCIMLSIRFIGETYDFPLDYYVLPIAAFFYASVLMAKNRNFYFSLGILIALSFIGYYILKDDKLKLSKRDIGNKITLGIIGAAAAFFVFYVGGLTTLRYLNYSTSTYDFGIFAQMFYHMKETLLPNTTCERTQLLSHYAVHLSPIFYVLLPGYYLFSSPVYLQIIQALVLGSAVIPLFLLARHHSLTNKVIICVCVAFCFYPALAGGCFYDIHENIFLTPLVLWLLYFIEKQRWPYVYLFAFLTCLVKEDAFIYVACIAAFLFITKQKRKHGAIMLSGSVLYFIGASIFLNHMGLGTMSGRFDNLISDQKLGLLSIFKTVLLNPAYVLCQILTQEKLSYLLLMLLPLLFIPLINRKLSQLILVIPFLLINLISNYPYQHSILFQYNFGTIALFFYLVIVNISDISGRLKKYAAPFMAVASILLFISNIGGYMDNISRYYNNKSQIQQLNTYLEAIPENASVQASGYFVPKLSNHLVLYDVRYNNELQTPYNTDYIVLDLRPNNEKDAGTYKQKYEEQGYESVVYQEGLICVLKK